MGNHRIAVETGRVASRLTNTDPNADRLRGRALCALGFALTCSGDEEALEVLLDAERAERTRAAALWHWAQFCIGAFLRDRGYAQPAVIWLSRSGVAIRHERAWFAIRGGDVSGAGEWVTPPIRADERPFARTVLAALRTARGRPGAERVAIKAATEFAHLGMHHWSWGARWIAAASPELNARRRASFVGDLVAELAERSAMHWGFFDPVSAMRALTSIPRQGMPHHAQRLVVHLSTWSSPPQYEDGALLGVLRFVKADGLSTLADAGLTPTELRALIVALELWLEHGEASRSAMASRLHARESSVRSLIGDIRSKLGIRGRRGVEPLVAWLAARDVLTPSTAMQVIRRLTR